MLPVYLKKKLKTLLRVCLKIVLLVYVNALVGSNMDELEQEKLDQMAAAQAGQNRIDEFLNVIRQIESSGGLNTNHPVMQQGIHKGEAAIGQYGLMPKTIQELAKRAGESDLAAIDSAEIPAMVKSNPGMEDRLARQLAERVLARQSDPEKAAYSWNMGHNLSPEQVTKRDYGSHPYVQKFRKIQEMLSKPPIKISQKD